MWRRKKEVMMGPIAPKIHLGPGRRGSVSDRQVFLSSHTNPCPSPLLRALQGSTPCFHCSSWYSSRLSVPTHSHFNCQVQKNNRSINRGILPDLAVRANWTQFTVEHQRWAGRESGKLGVCTFHFFHYFIYLLGLTIGYRLFKNYIKTILTKKAHRRIHTITQNELWIPYLKFYHQRWQLRDQARLSHIIAGDYILKWGNYHVSAIVKEMNWWHIHVNNCIPFCPSLLPTYITQLVQLITLWVIEVFTSVFVNTWWWVQLSWETSSGVEEVMSLKFPVFSSTFLLLSPF